METLAQAPKPGILPSTKAQLEAVQPVLWDMAMPEVREALGYSEEPVSVAPHSCTREAGANPGRRPGDAANPARAGV
ncbi:MAG: hypothetical protein V1724_00180 [Chloroflexota bacterium]